MLSLIVWEDLRGTVLGWINWISWAILGVLATSEGEAVNRRSVDVVEELVLVLSIEELNTSAIWLTDLHLGGCLLLLLLFLLLLLLFLLLFLLLLVLLVLLFTRLQLLLSFLFIFVLKLFPESLFGEIATLSIALFDHVFELRWAGLGHWMVSDFLFVDRFGRHFATLLIVVLSNLGLLFLRVAFVDFLPRDILLVSRRRRVGVCCRVAHVLHVSRPVGRLLHLLVVIEWVARLEQRCWAACVESDAWEALLLDAQEITPVVWTTIDKVFFLLIVELLASWLLVIRASARLEAQELVVPVRWPIDLHCFGAVQTAEQCQNDLLF